MSNVHYAEFKQFDKSASTRYKLARGFYLNKDTRNNNIYMTRMWCRKSKKYIYNSTKETTLNKATKIAYEYYEDFLKAIYHTK